MDDLETLRDGDRVTVETHQGDVDYRVHGVTVYRKATLAQDAARIFSQERPGRLVLITCEDWDGTRYLSNAVVVARPV
jgi:sortase (surface protein transpeptidase)